MNRLTHNLSVNASKLLNIILISFIIGIVNLGYGIAKEQEYINTKNNYPHPLLGNKYIEEVEQKIEFYRLIRVGGSAIAFLSLSSFFALRIVKIGE